MTILITALFFAFLGAAIVAGLSNFLSQNGDKIASALAGESLTSRGSGGPVVVNVRWKSRGEPTRTMVFGATPGWRAAA